MLWRYEDCATEEDIKNKDYKYYLLVVFFLVIFVLLTWFITSNINIDAWIWNIMKVALLLLLVSLLHVGHSAVSNLSSLPNYKCADVYCINTDTYSKLDLPTDPIRVKWVLNAKIKIQNYEN